MANQPNSDTLDQIGRSDVSKRVKLAISNACFLDKIISVPDRDDGEVTILAHTKRPPVPTIDADSAILAHSRRPPVLTVDDPFDIVGKSRIQDRPFQIESMFNTFESMLFSTHANSRFMSMVSYYFPDI